MVSEVYRFAGTLDKLALLKDVPIVLDLKTGVIQPWTAIQVAAYHILVNEPQRKRYAVQLNNDGSYRLQEFKDRSDRGVFLAALSTYTWKQKNGGKNNG